EVLDMPLNTVKSHIRRGKERLAALLQMQEQPPAARPVPPAPQRTNDQRLPGIAPFRLMPRMLGR
ncbi:MAG: RNA polymerase subunit sigma-24, partial [Chloroflexaceae bacterium]|nr:RNA polymerase subunit sigma-24 [Chloroflexaceae bacterium]